MLTALIGMAATAVGFMLLPVSQGTAAVTHSSQKHHHKKPGTTVSGPKMWNPLKNRRFSRNSTITVNQTAHLTNEMISVSWTGFTPSSSVIYDPDTTDYPVLIAECDSVKVTRWSQCYGANNQGVEGSFGPFGPENTAYATTAPNGTGQADIQILIADQNQMLGCGLHHRCSLVIVPAQGGDTLDSPINCRDHFDDQGGTDVGQFAFTSQNGQCSWKARIVIPLNFEPAADNCAIKTADFTALGSPMLDRAIESWIAELCAQSPPLTMTYNPAITEPEAIGDLPTGLGDIALTSRLARRKSAPGNIPMRRSPYLPSRSRTGWTARSPGSRSRN